jgi:hypothetical protein
MAVISLPTDLKVGVFDLALPDYTLRSISEPTGSVQSRLLSPPRLMLHMGSADPLSLADGAPWEVLVFQLRGGVNHLACHDIGKPAPRGTMRGTMTLSSSASAGATSLVITAGVGQASTTLLRGDWLQVGTPGPTTSQLVKVMADATANGSGVITVTIEPPLRMAYSSSAAVAWDKPLAYFKRIDTASWSHMPGLLQRGFAVNALENWNS